MSTRNDQTPAYCPLRIGRRNFLAAAGASAVAFKMGAFDFASPLWADEKRKFRKPRIRALFVRPSDEDYWMSWPGAAFDPVACQAEYTKTLTRAAKELGVHLDVSPLPLHEPDSVSGVLQQLAQNPPDGVIITIMHVKSWPQVEYLAKNRGDLPAIVFAPLGTSFAERQQATANVPKTFVAATHDHSWLTSGMRMLNTVWEMNHTRICILTDVVQGDRQAGKAGTTLHYIPLSRWTEEFNKAETTDEMREIAKHYAIEAEDIVEPEREDLMNAARGYVVARRIMEAEDCQGISVDCAQLIGNRQAPCGPCLAYSKLLDEGRVGACEADEDAAVSLLLAMRLFDRPGFMQDPAPNTVNNTLIGSHCTCATRLDGYDQPSAAFSLRTHFESDTGVAMQVRWPPGKEITVMKFQQPDSLVVGTGHVVGNVQTPFAGGCRTAVEFKLDNVADVRDIKGHHQVFVCGKFDNMLRGYCELTDMKLEHI